MSAADKQNELRQSDGQSAPHAPHGQEETREANQSLWLMVGSPLIWAIHFLTSYVTAAIWCAKVAGHAGSLGNVRVAIAIYTVVALAGIIVIGWEGLRRSRFDDSPGPHDFDSPADRHRFLGFATLLLSSLSAVATIFVSLAAVFSERCH